MFGSIIPQEKKFFDLFNQISQKMIEVTEEFQKMLANLDKSEEFAKKIKDIEHEADLITHQTMDLLHQTFITPLDREDIHLLITELDDVIDLVESAAERIHLYSMKKVPAEIYELARVCNYSALKLKEAVAGLSNLKNPDHINKICIEINKFENDGDSILRRGMAKLFKEENDIKELIKVKEVLELLETATDKCEDVANTIQGIVMEYA